MSYYSITLLNILLIQEVVGLIPTHSLFVLRFPVTLWISMDTMDIEAQFWV